MTVAKASYSELRTNASVIGATGGSRALCKGSIRKAVLMSAAAIACAVSACDWCPNCDDLDQGVSPYEVPAPPKVTSITIVPGEVQAPSGGLFQLQARVQIEAHNGTVVSTDSGYLPTWSWASDQVDTDVATFTPVVLNPQRVMIELPATTQGPPSLSIRASLGSHSAEARIVRVPPAGDRLLVDDFAGTLPPVALVDGTWGGTGVIDSAVSFVKGGSLGNVTGGPGKVALFTTAQRFSLIEHVPWSAKIGEIVRLSTASAGLWLDQDDIIASQTPEPVVVVPLNVLVGGTLAQAVTPEKAMEYARMQLRLAVSMYEASRTGLTFSIADSAFDLNIAAEIDGSSSDCKSLQIPAQLNTKAINVVYVEYVKAGGGFACRRSALEPGTKGEVLFVSWGHEEVTTLAHELGHVLSLRDDVGHTDTIFGFDPANIMWGSKSHYLPIGRHLISLGQTYRMIVHNASWLALAEVEVGSQPQLSVLAQIVATCQPEPHTNQPCPFLREDVPGSGDRESN